MIDKTGCTIKEPDCDGHCEKCGWHSAEIRRRKMILERNWGDSKSRKGRTQDG